MKTLIVYATKTGTVQKAAEMINEQLKEKAEMIDIGKNKIPNIDAYDFVVIGGSIRMGKVQNGIVKFIENNRAALKKKPMGMFLACGYPENLQDYFNVILGDLREYAIFKVNIGYAYYLEKSGFFEKQVIKSLVKVTQTTEAFNRSEIKKIAEMINK